MDKVSQGKESLCARKGKQPKVKDNDLTPEAPEAFTIDAATQLEDLGLPSSNQLQALKGERKGQWSIRINDQWRICFEWRDGNAEKVEIVDYH